MKVIEACHVSDSTDPVIVVAFHGEKEISQVLCSTNKIESWPSLEGRIEKKRGKT